MAGSARNGLLELATGRFYIGGEPEVRIRHLPPASSTAGLLTVMTLMGDGNAPVGLTCSLFASDGLRPKAAALAAAVDDVKSRVEACGGRVLRQDAGTLPSLPDNLARFVVIALLQAANGQFAESPRHSSP